MSCGHHDKRSVNGVMAGDGKLTYGCPPASDEEPAWCGTCGCLWANSLFGWAWMHPKNNKTAPTLMNLMRQSMDKGEAEARLSGLKKRLQEKVKDSEMATTIEKAAIALEVMKERGITVDKEKLQALEDQMREVQPAMDAWLREVGREDLLNLDDETEKLAALRHLQKTLEKRVPVDEAKLAEGGARTGTISDMAYKLAQTAQSILNNKHILGLVLHVVTEEGTLVEAGPLGVVFVRKGFPQAAALLTEALERTPGDLALAEKIAAGQGSH